MTIEAIGVVKDDHVDESAHILAEANVPTACVSHDAFGTLFYTHDNTRAVKTNCHGQVAGRYLFDLVTMHVWNV
jgi:hypothetical protein